MHPRRAPVRFSHRHERVVVRRARRQRAIAGRGRQLPRPPLPPSRRPSRAWHAVAPPPAATTLAVARPSCRRHAAAAPARVQLELLGTCVEIKSYGAFASLRWRGNTGSSPCRRSQHGHMHPTHWSISLGTRRVDRSELHDVVIALNPGKSAPAPAESGAWPHHQGCARTQCGGRAFFNLSARDSVATAAPGRRTRRGLLVARRGGSSAVRRPRPRLCANQ